MAFSAARPFAEATTPLTTALLVSCIVTVTVMSSEALSGVSSREHAGKLQLSWSRSFCAISACCAVSKDSIVASMVNVSSRTVKGGGE